MNRRVLVDDISDDPDLAGTGMTANLIFDRLLLITDDAGLAPGEAAVIKGRCFPMLEEMTTAIISKALNYLIDASLLLRGRYRGRVVICYKSDSSRTIRSSERITNGSLPMGDFRKLFGRKGIRHLLKNPNGIRTVPERNPYRLRTIL